MVNDPIGDMLIQIKNAQAAGKKSVDLPYSNMKAALGEILVAEKYIESIKKTGTEPKFVLHIVLREVDGVFAISGVRRVSKPGLRWYIDKNEIPRVFSGMGTAILSTSKGMMTGRAAKKLGIGGELLCEVW